MTESEEKPGGEEDLKLPSLKVSLMCFRPVLWGSNDLMYFDTLCYIMTIVICKCMKYISCLKSFSLY
jgi:hypothetical protein